jgi:uncharacterized membrane protein YbhN (UPF0104 family)
MFYNLFLPGAISGDAYKVVILYKRKGVSYKKASAAVLLDRFSGVLALGAILAVYGIWMLPTGSLKALFLSGAILSILGFYLLLRFWMKDFLPGFVSTFTWSLAVQLCQVVSVYLIMASLGIPLSMHQWVFIFLCSALISILPLSLGGGLGTREVVFAEGARIFHLDPAMGVVISLLFYLVTVVGSLGGLYYQFHDPMKE